MSYQSIKIDDPNPSMHITSHGGKLKFNDSLTI